MSEFISWTEAKAKSLRHYFTGKPCLRGHISKRFVSTKQCVQCSAGHRRRYVKTNQSRVVMAMREGELRRRYNWTQAKYLKMYDDQDGCCAICFDKFEKTPHIDHCHETGKVRGLLCSNCNTALGLFKDNPDRLHSAISYLNLSLI